MTAADPGSPVVHINSLRWFVEQDGGAEFVRSHGDEVRDEVITRALAAAYPEALHVVTALRAAGVGADCWFTPDDEASAAVVAEITSATQTARAVSLGGLALSAEGRALHRVASRVAITGLTCTGSADAAIALAAVALADAFGPHVVWDAGLADVMLVDTGTTLAAVRARWRPKV